MFDGSRWRGRKNEAMMERIRERAGADRAEEEAGGRGGAEPRERHIRGLAEADRQRQQKAIAQREAMDRQAEEEKRVSMQRRKEQVAHEM
jgi:hypothetical protein